MSEIIVEEKFINTQYKLVSLVIPIFNNSQSLQILFEKIRHQFTNVIQWNDFEIIFVDDGSTDDSWEVIESLKSLFPEKVIGIKLSRNFGQLAAMIAGWEEAHGDAVINMSADLQDPPELVSDLVEKWQEGADLVLGIRENREDGFFVKFTSACASKIIRKSNPLMPETWFDYTLMSRRVLEVVKEMKGRYRFSQGDMLHAGFKRVTVPYTRAKRPFGKSGYTFWKRLENFTNTILDSSYLLIQFFIRIGVLFSGAAIAYAIWIVIARTANWIPSTGWAPIMVVLLISSGIIMMMLGVIAEYLWRIYDSTRHKPVYVVERKI